MIRVTIEGETMWVRGEDRATVGIHRSVAPRLTRFEETDGVSYCIGLVSHLFVPTADAARVDAALAELVRDLDR